MAKNYLAQQEQQGMGVYDVREEHEPNLDDFVDQDQEQFEDLATLQNPDVDSLLIAHQEAKKKIQYKKAWTMLTKSRTSREFYPHEWTIEWYQGQRTMEAHLTLTVTACGVASMVTKLGVAPR